MSGTDRVPDAVRPAPASMRDERKECECGRIYVVTVQQKKEDTVPERCHVCQLAKNLKEL